MARSLTQRPGNFFWAGEGHRRAAGGGDPCCGLTRVPSPSTSWLCSPAASRHGRRIFQEGDAPPNSQPFHLGLRCVQKVARPGSRRKAPQCAGWLRLWGCAGATPAPNSLPVPTPAPIRLPLAFGRGPWKPRSGQHRRPRTSISPPPQDGLAAQGTDGGVPGLGVGGRRLTGGVGRAVGFFPLRAAPDFHPAPRRRYYRYVLRDAKRGVKGRERRKVTGRICCLFCRREPGCRSLGRTVRCHCTSQTSGCPRSCFSQLLKKHVSFVVPRRSQGLQLSHAFLFKKC